MCFTEYSVHIEQELEVLEQVFIDSVCLAPFYGLLFRSRCVCMCACVMLQYCFLHRILVDDPELVHHMQ